MKNSENLYYLNMTELKQLCAKLGIPLSKGKGDMIDAIQRLLTTGKLSQPKKIPARSRAQAGCDYPLAEETLMLYGAYKNDAKTRAFFKKLIGPHFHFTAFGIDWLKERWYAGRPPTYREYADMWVEESKLRNKVKPSPKKEWAYINFLQQFGEKNPHATATQARAAWKKLREEKVAGVLHELQKIRL